MGSAGHATTRETWRACAIGANWSGDPSGIGCDATIPTLPAESSPTSGGVGSVVSVQISLIVSRVIAGSAPHPRHHRPTSIDDELLATTTTVAQAFSRVSLPGSLNDQSGSRAPMTRTGGAADRPQSGRLPRAAARDIG